MAFRRQPAPAAMHHPAFADSIDDDETSDTESTSASSSSSRSSSSSASTGYLQSPIRSFRSSLSTASYMTSTSESYVYCDDPTEYWGWGGYMGAVTRVVDTHDNPGTKFAAHFMAGPFAQMSKKELRRRRRRRSSGGSDAGSVRMVAPGGMPAGYPAMHGGAGGVPPPPRPTMGPGAGGGGGGGGHYNFGGGGGGGGVAGIRPGMPPAGWGAMGGGAMPRPGMGPGRTVDPVWGTQAQQQQQMPAARQMFNNVRTGGPARMARPQVV